MSDQVWQGIKELSDSSKAHRAAVAGDVQGARERLDRLWPIFETFFSDIHEAIARADGAVADARCKEAIDCFEAGGWRNKLWEIQGAIFRVRDVSKQAFRKSQDQLADLIGEVLMLDDDSRWA
jgi:hypothetical protein